ncbi:MAG: EAL domain-containing protein [Fibrobacteraceae bacterium]|nr:EAL domain-containing protein [Fibrobacteraceae bacterium]
MSPVETPAYLARQPILNREGRIFAYELLFRDSPDNESAIIKDGVRATAEVLENVLNNIGLSKLIGNHKAFINCSREMLLDNIFGPLDSRRFVLEILETVSAEPAVVSIVKNYHDRGFELALDDVVFEENNLKRIEPFFPYVSYVKLDLVENTPEALKAAVPYFKERNMVLLAEKVETESEFKTCLSEGYELFQGFFFAKPQLVTGSKIDGTTAAILRLIQFLRGDPTLSEIEQAFLGQPTIAQSLLKYVNSEAALRRKPILSISDAVMWLGVPQLQDWLMLMLYARPEMGENLQSAPLFQNVSQRAKFLESLAVVLDPKGALPAQAFIAGIMSRMDALVKAPLPSILVEFNVDKEIADALLRKEGRLGLLLRLVDAVEGDQRKEVGICVRELGLSSEVLMRCLSAAYGGGSCG